MLTLEQLLAIADEIKFATETAEITAQKVGEQFKQMIYYFINQMTGGVGISLDNLYAPRDTYLTVLALETAFPTGAEGIYVVTGTGNWYFWNAISETWQSGGLYQAALDIANELGTSETKVINQKVVTQEINKLANAISYIETNTLPLLALTPENYPNYAEFTSNIWYNKNAYFTKKSKIISVEVVFDAAGTFNIYAINKAKDTIRVVGTVSPATAGYHKFNGLDIELQELEGITIAGVCYRIVSGKAYKYNLSGTTTSNEVTDGVEFGYGFTTAESLVSEISADLATLKTDFLIQSKLLKYRVGTGNYPAFGNYYFSGRWFPKTISAVDYMVTINQGAEIFVKVKGTTQVTGLFLDVSSSGHTPYIAISVDGGAFVRKEVTSSLSLITGLSTSEHYIRIIASGIYESDAVWEQGQGLVFKGLTVDGGGTIEPVIPQNRYGLFIGDSITAGINVLGVGAIPLNNCAEKAFPYIACYKLNSACVRVGFGGSGLTQWGNGSVPPTINYIDYAMYLVLETAQIPDFIVLNLGTNDTAASDTDFITAYNLVINRLKIKYPGVDIFIMTTFGGYKYNAIIELAADNDLILVDTLGWGVTYTDSLHPDEAGSLTAGTKLAAYIKNTLGSNFFQK